MIDCAHMGLLGKQQRRDQLICYLKPSSPWLPCFSLYLLSRTHFVREFAAPRLLPVVARRFTSWIARHGDHGSCWRCPPSAVRVRPALLASARSTPVRCRALTTARLGSGLLHVPRGLAQDVTCNPIIERPRAFLFALRLVYLPQPASRSAPVEHTVSRRRFFSDGHTLHPRN